ncbi:xylulokinase [Pseudaestuariivita atlantica]|uniref:Xylulose kinase n=1 Tax=Pseudaestuariivita atlantica TaxID=1317121 RepID=A0A0L1JPW3_9RHOB|nr:xylulokinase [Pseudaestuariivita atlantica]KNG93762.1 xylulose kinase [Pseudaestuariivita atlantica]
MFLGLDLGTSGLRALLVDDTGASVASAEAGYSVSHPASGWSEQDPAHWITACDSAMRALAADHPGPMSAVRALAISGHMHGAVLVDDTGAPLRPCILWNDTRSHAQAARLDATPGVREASGNIVFPGFTAPKLVWVAEEEPDIFARVAMVHLPKDYLIRHLTGEAVAEMSDAAGSAWLDIAARDWSALLLDAGGMDRAQMPRLIEGTEVAGTLRADLARDWGLPSNVQVVGGGADNAVAACGVGAWAEGAGFVSLGTSGVILAARDTCAPMPETAVHTFCHAIPERWYQMSVMLAATDSLNWLGGITGQPPAALSDLLPDAPTGPSSAQFAPYLSGERTPHNDAAIRGGFTGLDIAHGPADMAQAVMEGVAFGLRDGLEALKATGARLDRLIAIGGGTQSPFWCQTLANVLGVPLDLPAQGEFGAAMGAARLAICGATGADVAGVMTRPDIARTIDPDTTLTHAYSSAYARFTATYPALSALQGA